MKHSELDALQGAAARLGLDLVALEGALIGNYRFVSRLCSTAYLPWDMPENLQSQLELFASLDNLARSQFLLGVGIASDV